MTVYSDYRGLLDSSLNATARWNGMESRGAPITLTYSFRDSAALGDLDHSLLTDAGASAFEVMTSFQKAKIRQALTAVEAQVGIKFIEINDGGMLDFSGMRGSQDVSGFGYYPYVTDSRRSDNSSIILDTDESNASFSPGGRMYMVALHEVGHTLGLNHSFDEGLGTNSLSPGLDNQTHTVMAYDEVSPFPTSFRHLDVDALKFLYGDKTTPQLGFNYNWNQSRQEITITGTSRSETLIGTNEKTILVGGSGTDILVGRDASDVLKGGAGNDRLDAGGGNDVMIGGAGADRFDGGTGSDTASYAGATAGVTASLNTKNGATGEAIGDTFARVENLTGSSFHDTLSGNGGTNVLRGENGNDTLTGTGYDKLYGGNGNDLLIHSGRIVNSIVLDGGAGEDVAQVNGIVDLTNSRYRTKFVSIEKIVGGSTNDTFTGDSEDNTFDGGAAQDRLFGGLGDDILYGSAGNDQLTGGRGADLLDGGTGSDRALYANANSSIRADLADTSANLGDAAGDTYVSIESIYASRYDDQLLGDNLNNGLYGENGDDTLHGREGNDVLNGGAGNDLLVGGAGADRFFGGYGIDTASYVGASDSVTVNLGTSSGGTGDAAGDWFNQVENIIGSDFDDTLSGSVGTNVLRGENGNDTISGTGFDKLYGGDGDDLLIHTGVAFSSIVVDGGDGEDTARVNGFLDLTQSRYQTKYVSIEKFVGGSSNDTFTGDAEDNHFDGGAHEDRLSGGEGDDLLYGNNGNDLLTGGEGADLLNGGAGNDGAQYLTASSSIRADLTDSSLNTGEAAGDIYISIEAISGSGYDDQVFGDDLDNILSGESGNDDLHGRAGDDALVGGFGHDVLVGGVGADILNGSSGQDTASYSDAETGLRVDLQVNSVNTGDAVGDQFISIEGVSGSAFDDRLSGDAADNALSGEDGNDIIDGRDGSDTLSGGEGDDLFIASNGGDSFSGGAGSDRVDYGRATANTRIDMQAPNAGTGIAQGDTFDGIEAVSGSMNADRINGNADGNELFGKAGADTLNGRDGNDTLRGGDDNDTLIGGAGRDAILGGDGFDRVLYNTAATRVVLNLETGANAGDALGDTFDTVELFSGSAHNDLFVGADADDRLWTQAGDDIVYGNGGDDDLRGGSGDDILFGGAGADALYGGDGIDQVRYGDATSGLVVDFASIAANTGIAAGDIYSSIEDLMGSSFDDTLRGDGAANMIAGQDGRDVIIGRGGDDDLKGGSGDDVFFGGSGADAINGGTGIDRASYGDASAGVWADLQFAHVNQGIAAGDTYQFVEDLSGSSQDDLLRGDDGDNQLWGFNGNDRLNGRNGEDSLVGGNGDDLLIGGSGDDVLNGGGGSDSFAFLALDSSVDTILDFTAGEDRVRLDDVGFGLSRGTVAEGSFVLGNAALDADDVLLYDNGALYFDADGNGAGEAVQIATFSNAAALTGADFEII